MMPRLLLASALAVFLLATLGCTSGRGFVADSSQFSFHRDPSIESVRRIVVMPMHRASGVGKTAVAVDLAIPAAWRELGTFEVINATMAERDLLIPDDAFRTRRISAEQLRQVYADFRADAVLLGRIEHLDSFDPVSLSLEIAMISCLDGRVLWSASGNFDGARQAIQKDIEAWFHKAGGRDNASVSGWRSALQSPRVFARYVADRLAVSTLNPEIIEAAETKPATGTKGGTKGN
ncbi:MAG: hypothetical protein PF961_22645 [Planctomycetota bacterium]|jgi:hypothetical protein|nr:hypothetical protein [Planctomycetota bacterium]